MVGSRLLYRKVVRPALVAGHAVLRRLRAAAHRLPPPCRARAGGQRRPLARGPGRSSWSSSRSWPPSVALATMLRVHHALAGTEVGAASRARRSQRRAARARRAPHRHRGVRRARVGAHPHPRALGGGRRLLRQLAAAACRWWGRGRPASGSPARSWPCGAARGWSWPRTRWSRPAWCWPTPRCRAASFLERAVAKPDTDTPTAPAVVATLPAGATWPVDRSVLGSWARTRRVRRWAAGLLILAGVVNIVSRPDRPVAGASPAHRGRHPAAVPPGRQRARRADRRGPDRPGPRRAAGLPAGVGHGRRAPRRHVVRDDLQGHRHRGGGARAPCWPCGSSSSTKHFRVLPPGHRRWAAWAVAFALGAVVVAAALAALFGREERLGRVAAALGIGLVVLLGVVRRTRAARACAVDERRRRRVAGQGPRDRRALRGRHPRLLRPPGRQEPAVLRRRPRGLHGARPHDAGVARPDLSAPGAQRHVGRRPWITPTSTVGASPCWRPTPRGCRSTTPAGSRTCTSATRRSSSASSSRSRARR